MAFILGEMGAMKGFQDRSDVTRLNALVSVLTGASVWRMDNGGGGGDARTTMTSPAAVAISRGRMMMVPSKGVAVGGEEFLDSGCIFF